MRLGLISDIHGNLLALDAVIGELNESGIDRLVCLGDLAAGPEPRATIGRLRELDCPVVLGNWDSWLLPKNSWIAAITGFALIRSFGMAVAISW